jgi:hypothetical protein
MENSIAVPIPRLVMILPSTTTFYCSINQLSVNGYYDSFQGTTVVALNIVNPKLPPMSRFQKRTSIQNYGGCMPTTSFQIQAVTKRPVHYGHYIDGPASGCYDFKQSVNLGYPRFSGPLRFFGKLGLESPYCCNPTFILGKIN